MQIKLNVKAKLKNLIDRTKSNVPLHPSFRLSYAVASTLG